MASRHEYPQVLQLAELDKKCSFRPSKPVWSLLGGRAEALSLVQDRGELLLSAHGRGEAIPLVKSKLILPEMHRSFIRLARGVRVALIERNGAVAVKRFESVVETGDRAALTDEETGTLVTRRLVRTPMSTYPSSNPLPPEWPFATPHSST